MKVIKKFTSALFLCVLSLFISIGIFLTFPSEMVASAESGEFEITDGMYDNFTDSDLLINSNTKKIFDYPTDASLYRATSNITRANGEFNLSITGDDAIVQIIPKELFYNIGNHLYIGREYGFFVKTEAERFDYRDENNNWQSTVSNCNRKSTVMVFDITTQDNFIETIDRLIVKVSPIFQFEYAYIDSSQSYLTLATNSNKSRYEKQVLYSISGNAVVPIGPVSLNTVIYEQVEKFYLKDISFGAKLLNEQAPNVFLPSNYYDVNNDNGAFFISYDYTYNGISRKDGDFPIGNTVLLGLDTASLVLGFLSKGFSVVCPPAAAVSKVLSIATGALSFAHSAGSTGIEIYNAATPSNVSISSGELTVVPYYTTKAQQIAYYGGLTKEALIAFNTPENESVWYTNGSDATAYFTVSNSAQTLESEYQTRIIRDVGVKVVDENGKELTKSTTSYSYINGAPIKESIKLGDVKTTYLLPYGNNYYDFYAQYTSDYKIKIDTTEDISLKANGNIIPQNNDGSFNVKLYGGTNNLLQVSNGFSHIVSDIKIEPSSDLANINISSNAEYLVKYDMGIEGNLFTLKTSAGSLSDICQVSESGFLTRLDLLDDYKEKSSVDVYMDPNTTYYLVMKNDTASSITANLSFNQLNYSLDVGTGSSRLIEKDNNFVYYKFSVPAGNTNDYVFLFNGIINEIDIYNFIILDDKGKACSVLQFSYGYLKGLSLKPGSVYYVGIKSNVEKTTVPTVQRNEATLKWKIIQGTTILRYDSQNSIELTRGYTYKFELWLNDTVKVRTIHKISDTSNGLGLSNINNVTGSITITPDRKDGTNFTLVGLYENDPELSGYPLGLLVKVLYNPKELTYDSIQYNNAIKVSWKSLKDVVCVFYKVSGTNENGSSFNYTGSTTGIQVDCLSNLISQKAVYDAEFTITGVTIKTGDYNATRLFTMDKSITINCMYSKYEVEKHWIFTSHYYYISNALQVYNIRHDMSYTRFLDVDINMGYYSSWNPIETLDCSINGMGHKLTNMKITIPTSPSNELYYGFVGINNSRILNLTIQNIIINSTSGSHNKPIVNVGAIAGMNSSNASVVLCNATGTINVHHNNSRVGGLVGHNLGLITHSNFGSFDEAQSLVNGNGDMAGIAGQSCGTVTYCNVYNSRVHSYIVGINRSSGGIVGYNYGGDLTYSNVYAVEIAFTGYGNLSASSLRPNMGIIVGHIENSNLHYVGRDNAGVNIGSLNSKQAKNCANGPWGVYGIAINTSVK